jgi:hypothetical protein
MTCRVSIAVIWQASAAVGHTLDGPTPAMEKAVPSERNAVILQPSLDRVLCPTAHNRSASADR